MLTGWQWTLRIASRILVVLLPLLTGLVAARSLGPSGRGLIALGIGLAVGGAALAGLGYGHVARQQLRSKVTDSGARSLVAIQVRRILLVSAPVAFVAGLVAYGVISAQDLLSRTFIAATVILSAISALHQFLASALVGLGSHWLALVGDVIPWVVALPAFGLSIVGGFPSAAVYMSAVAGGYLIGLLFLGYWTRRKLQGFREASGHVEGASAPERLASRSPWVFDVLDFGTTKSDRLYAALVMPAGDAGLYAIAGTFTAIWRFLPMSVGLLGPSRSVVRLPAALGPIFSHPIALGAALVALPLGVTALIGPSIAVWMLGFDYVDVATPMRLLCLGEFGLAIYILFSLSMVGTSATRDALAPAVAGSLTLPFMMAGGYHWFGLSGAAAATAIVWIGVAVLTFSARTRARSQGRL